MRSSVLGRPLLAALVVVALVPLPGHASSGSFELFVYPGTCGAKRTLDLAWSWWEGSAVRPGSRIVLDASWDGGHTWMKVAPIPVGRKTRLRINVDELRKRARRDSEYRSREAYFLRSAGQIAWWVRARVPETSYISPPTEFVIDQQPPSVSIVSPQGAEPTVDDTPVLDRPLAIVKGPTTLRARAFDTGAGFGQTIVVPMWHWFARPAINWSLVNEATGETTKLVSRSQGDQVVEDRQVFDFSAKPGVYAITVTAEDCLGNTASETVRVIGA